MIDTQSVLEFQDNLGSFGEILESKNPRTWSGEEVKLYLDRINLGKFAKQFEENLIEGETLLKINEDDLRELGITKRGDVIVFRENLKKLIYLSREEF